MNTRTILMWVYSFADPRVDGVLEGIGSAFDGAPRELLPDVLDADDPPTTRLESMSTSLLDWRTQIPPRGSVLLHGSGVDPKGSTTLSLVTNRSPEAQTAKPVRKGAPVQLWMSDISCAWDAAWFDTDNRLDAVRLLFAGVCEAFHAFLGTVVATDASTQFWKEFGGREIAEANLGDVCWLNYYGNVTVERLGGAGHLSGLGVRQARDASGGLLIEATPDPWYYRPDATGIDDYAFKQPFYDTIGRSAFAHGNDAMDDPSPLLPTMEEQYRGVPQLPEPETLGP